MAQAGFTPISLYYSTTASAVPTNTNLVAGELAINITDGKLYFKNNSNVVTLLASAAGASGDVVGPASSTDNAVARFDLTTGKLIQNSGVIISDANAVSGVTQLDVDNLRLDGNTISSTDSNGNVVIAPNGTGDVQLDADTVRIGDSNANATLTTNGTGDLILNTNSGTNSGSITIEDGVNGNIIIAPNGTGQVQITNAVIDTTTIEVTNIRAKDGTAAMTIADTTGIVTVSSELNVDNINLSANTISTTNANGNLSITPNGTGYVIFSGTQAILVPKGNNTTQRPGTPVTGMLRYNTTTDEFEGYSGAAPSWKSVGGAAISNDTSTASDLYPAFLTATSGTASTINTSNAKLLYKPSTGEFKASAPVASNGIFVNNTTVAASYTIDTGNNGMSVGPITVNSGITVTVSSGQRWLVL